jgi:hypothetical protein
LRAAGMPKDRVGTDLNNCGNLRDHTQWVEP